MANALADFRSSLDRIRDIADDNDRNASLSLSNSAVRARYETTRCAAAVILSGFFESYLKQLADQCISAVCALNRPFSTLPDKIRYSHYELGGSVLSRRAQDDRASRPSRISASADDIAGRLASVVSTPYDLVWEGFAETNANPNSNTIADYLKRFGISQPWDRVATEVGSSANVLRTALDAFLLLRNECAHTGSAATVPTPSEIRGFCDLLESIAAAMLKVLQDHVNTI